MEFTFKVTSRDDALKAMKALKSFYGVKEDEVTLPETPTVPEKPVAPAKKEKKVTKTAKVTHTQVRDLAKQLIAEEKLEREQVKDIVNKQDAKNITDLDDEGLAVVYDYLKGFEG